MHTLREQMSLRMCSTSQVFLNSEKFLESKFRLFHMNEPSPSDAFVGIERAHKTSHLFLHALKALCTQRTRSFVHCNPASLPPSSLPPSLPFHSHLVSVSFTAKWPSPLSPSPDGTEVVKWTLVVKENRCRSLPAFLLSSLMLDLQNILLLTGITSKSLTFSYYNDQSVNLFRAGSPHKCALAPGLVAVLLRVAPRGVQTSGSQEQ